MSSNFLVLKDKNASGATLLCILQHFSMFSLIKLSPSQSRLGVDVEGTNVEKLCFN